jgi:STE24 endopeptidase
MTRRAKPPIEIPGLDVKKAKRYSRIHLGLFAASTALGVARSLWLADQRRSRRLKEAVSRAVPDQRLTGPVFLAALTGVSWLASLPVAYLGGHLVERRFGLTKQSTAGWLGDAAKGLGLGLALQVPLTAGAFAIIRRRPDDWWLVLSGIAVPLTVLAGNLAPVLILPLFNRFDPIADDALRGRVRALAERSGVNIADVYRMDMSRQSEKPNAFFTGIGRTKRIVLGDTLIERFTPAEVDGVVAHELGHQVHGDIWRMIALSGGVGFAAAYALHRIAPWLVERTADRTGVTELGDEAALPLISVVLAGLGLVTGPLVAAVSRAIERRTDRFALQLTGDGPAYAAAMERLATQALEDPDPPAPVVFLLYSHPPIAERIATARGFPSPVGAG